MDNSVILILIFAFVIIILVLMLMSGIIYIFYSFGVDKNKDVTIRTLRAAEPKITFHQTKNVALLQTVDADDAFQDIL